MKNAAIVGALLFMSQLVYAQSSISGKIIDKSGDQLPGASLSINGTNIVTVTDANGNYQLTNTQPFPWTVRITFVGYTDRTIVVNASGDQGTIILEEGVLLGNEVIISASRMPEKAIEAVASVTTLGEERIAATPMNGDPMEYLRNVQGVNVVRAGTESVNIELRGPVNVLETSTLVLKDYAPIVSVSDKTLFSPAGTLSPLDIERIEVVRGPSGALYGPNVTSGVVHFVTKDAFKHPGASAMVSVGQRNLLTSRIRYAGNNGNKLGWKFLVNYSQSNDFGVADDQLIANDGVTKVINTQDFETLGGKRWNNVDNLDDILLNNWNIEGGVEYRPTGSTKINYTTSFSRMITNVNLPIGHSFFGVQRFEQQLRVSSGNFFGTFYHRHNSGNVDSNNNPNGAADHVFLISYAGPEGGTATTAPQGAETNLDIALQYRFDLNPKINFQVGSDLKIIPSFEKIFAYGASSGENPFNIYGGYLSGKYHISERLNLNFAGRYDYFSAYEDGAFSPRAGLVFNPNEQTGIRLSYSRSYEAQSRDRTYLDFNFSQVLPPFFPGTHIVGVAQPVTYDNPVTRFAFGDVQGGESLDLQDIVDALAADAGVSAPTVSGIVDPTLTTASFVGPEVGISTGIPISLDEAGLNPPTLKTVNQVEFGFNTTLQQKIQFGLDIYHIWVENIQPTGEVPLTAGSQLDVAAVQTLIEQQIPAGPDRDALITSLNSVPANPTPNPGFDGTPGFGAVMSDRAQQFNYVYDLGFPTYGNENVTYFGTEFSATYAFSTDLSVFGNYTYVSQTFWSAADLGESNPEYAYYLNTPPNRVNLGVNYYPYVGFYGSFAMNYQSGYEGRQGDGRFFTGYNEARSIFDTQIGYRLSTSKNVRFDLALSVNNVFDKEYSHFIHLGQLRRWASVTLKVSL